MKKQGIIIVGGILALSLCACNSSGSSMSSTDTNSQQIETDITTEISTEISTEENISADTLAGKYEQVFMKTSGDTAKAIVDELMSSVNVEYILTTEEVNPGYLNGFDNEISGFEEGMKFSPNIGSIPFVAYVFKTSDPEALKETLNKNANLNWNICTSADEKVVAVNGDFVFFIMCLNEN